MDTLPVEVYKDRVDALIPHYLALCLHQQRLQQILTALPSSFLIILLALYPPVEIAEGEELVM
ncbi:hypothetical protein IQ268_21390 [Oculatella sp. LEGE 06141]|uniref:hypothetical protein n=1 Tax=Oculatella sp. LEGE 06141 TaxID=1828648 RepID=UPI0018817B14|nr:hypothetical protein [Oculatella sp. LEGE 06141]MBE9181119.1 hypothetical protein [Oculatella sp. LEGE 06141]